MGLKLLLREGESHPIFDDPLYEESSAWVLSTSGLSAGDRFWGTGFGTVWPNGYGINCSFPALGLLSPLTLTLQRRPRWIKGHQVWNRVEALVRGDVDRHLPRQHYRRHARDARGVRERPGRGPGQAVDTTSNTKFTSLRPHGVHSISLPPTRRPSLSNRTPSRSSSASFRPSLTPPVIEPVLLASFSHSPWNPPTRSVVAMTLWHGIKGAKGLSRSAPPTVDTRVGKLSSECAE